MSSTKPATKSLQSKDVQLADRSTRLLLALWEVGEAGLLKGKLTDRLKRKGEKSSDYQDVIAQLTEKGAITLAEKKVVITEPGIERLGQSLQSSKLAIEGTIVGAWVARALYKWIRQTEVTASVPSSNGKGKVAGDAIASYEAFKPVALEVFDRLNRDYNYDNLVPIYRIRREIGDRVTRSDFNSWLLKMQSNDILHLQGGSVEDSATDKIEDSIKTEISGLRRAAKRLA